MPPQTDPDAQSALVRLPDDVLIRILGQLDLTTQLEMTNVHIRFLIMMPLIWRLQCKSITLSLIELDLAEKDLRFFLGSNQETFQVLRLKMTKQLQFDILIGYIFPNIHDFRFSTISFRLRDKDLERIIKSFPNLRTFSPQGSFTGKHLEHFPSLENLTLSHCSNIKLDNLVRILTTRKLKGLKLEIFDDEHFKNMKLPLEGIIDLEFLQCDAGEMDGLFLMHLDKLTKLKELHVSGLVNTNTVLNALSSRSRSRIKSVQIEATEPSIHILFH